MSSAAKLGVFMLAVLAILGYFILKIEDIPFGRGHQARTIKAVFDTVAGLDDKSAVRVAGVRIGKVAGIKLRPDGQAEVTLEIDEDVQLHSNASAKVANLGLLGEKYIELDPGTIANPLISAGQTGVVLRGSQPASIDDVTSQISAIAVDVKAITESLRNVIGGPAGEQRLTDIVDNVRTITAEVRDLIAANRSNVDATMANAVAISESLKVEIPRLANSIDHVASQIGGTVGENREDVRKIVENLRTLSSDLRTTTANLDSITGQIRSGEGTVGKLLYSNEAHDRLTSALASVESGVNELKTTLGRANRITMDVGMGADYYAGLPKQTSPFNTFAGNTRSTVFIRLNPNPERNRFFNIELADDPRGHEVETIFENAVTDPSGNTTTTTTKETKFDRNFLISAQAGWRLNPFSVRIGLFDNSGGIAGDYSFNDRVAVTGELFDFSGKRDPNPHLRLYSEYTFRREKKNTPLIFIRSGVDNIFNHAAFTLGGGIRWRDDDLKYLLTSLPTIR